MTRRLMQIVLMVACLLAWGLPAAAGSIEARILSKVTISGSQIFTLHRVRNRDPVEMTMTMATIEGNPNITQSVGTGGPANVVVSVPIADTASFAVGDWIKISWAYDISGELIGVNVREL